MNREDLSTLTGVSVRTIKRYIDLQLIRPAVGRTRAAVYDESHRADVLRVHALHCAGWHYDKIRQEMHARRALDGHSPKAEDQMTVEYRFPIGAGASVVFSRSGHRDDVARLEELATQIAKFVATKCKL